MTTMPLDDGLAFNLQKNKIDKPIPQNQFDKDEDWVTLIFAGVFIVCAVVSGYATFTGFRLFLQEVGDVGMLVNGTSVILTIAVVAILTVGWNVMCGWGPEARTSWLKFLMAVLGALLLDRKSVV